MIYTKEEKIIAEVIIEARKVQDFIWDRHHLRDHTFGSHKNVWVEIFQKRVDKISDINPFNPSSKIELRKRILQQATLSILALRVLGEE